MWLVLKEVSEGGCLAVSHQDQWGRGMGGGAGSSRDVLEPGPLGTPPAWEGGQGPGGLSPDRYHTRDELCKPPSGFGAWW